MLKLHHFRENYTKGELIPEQCPEHPVDLFKDWMNVAIEAKIPEPNAMVFASATQEGRPSARVLLLKSFDYNGFVFYTNYKSRKGNELETNDFGAIVFNWLELERQIRIEGRVVKTERSESEEYFYSRPRGSQLGAWCSPQSQPVSKEELEENMTRLISEYGENKEIPMPPYWGGYVLIPDKIEFWQGRPNRLHDRVLYTIEGTDWNKQRLAP